MCLTFSEFPLLKEAGGFQLLISKSKKVLAVAAIGPLPCSEMRMLTSGRVYVRPLQVDIPLVERTGFIVIYFMIDWLTANLVIVM